MDTSDLAKRMKEYEKAGERYLTRRMPVVLRFDGCHFHSLTKKFTRPFDEILIKTMQETTKFLCENIQGAVFGYTQSDEITIVLVDYKKINSSAWFNNRQNKMESVGASMATMAFNKIFLDNIDISYQEEFYKRGLDQGGTISEIDKLNDEYDIYYSKVNKAMFDCRAFNIPKEEVANNIYWRQLDCSRNSIQMVGQANFSNKELQNKSCNMIQDMLMTQKGINWNDLPTYQKRGSCVIKEEYAVNGDGEEVEIDYITDVDEPTEDVTFRTRWIIDKNIPIFRNEGREYIEKLVMVGE